MFAEACALASGFTRPVVISSRTVGSVCSSSVGACLVLNREGWVLTVAHLIDLIQQQYEAAQVYRKYRGDIRDLERDVVSEKKYRRKKLRGLARPSVDSVRDHSVWWGVDGAQLREVRVMPAADLALGRLEPFDSTAIEHYPVFKVPGGDYMPGRTLCKLGFAFHEVTPIYDEIREGFILPEGTVPLPLFPLEGMFTRILLAPAPGRPSDEPGKFIETSSPGLRGQSGGPIFDSEGVIWALQSHTRHYPLGFKPPVPGKVTGQVEHQFLNVGVGVHTEPILQFLEQHGIEHQRKT